MILTVKYPLLDMLHHQQGSMKNEWPWRKWGSLDDELTVDECTLKDLYNDSCTV